MIQNGLRRPGHGVQWGTRLMAPRGSYSGANEGSPAEFGILRILYPQFSVSSCKRLHGGLFGRAAVPVSGCHGSGSAVCRRAGQDMNKLLDSDTFQCIVRQWQDATKLQESRLDTESLQSKFRNMCNMRHAAAALQPRVDGI
jgi:hypothetical protein